jgi:hypothetical protein
MFALPRHAVRVLALAFAVLLIGSPAFAIDPPAGTKNFAVPPGVPNYFSNEVGAAPGSGGIVRSAPVPGQTVVVPVPSSRGSAVVSSRRGGRHYAYARGRGHGSRYAATRSRGYSRASVSYRRGGSRSSVSHGGSSRHVVRTASRSSGARRH